MQNGWRWVGTLWQREERPRGTCILIEIYLNSVRSCMWQAVAIEAYLFLKIRNEVHDYFRAVRFRHVVASTQSSTDSKFLRCFLFRFLAKTLPPLNGGLPNTLSLLRRLLRPSQFLALKSIRKAGTRSGNNSLSLEKYLGNDAFLERSQWSEAALFGRAQAREHLAGWHGCSPASVRATVRTRWKILNYNNWIKLITNVFCFHLFTKTCLGSEMASAASLACWPSRSSAGKFEAPWEASLLEKHLY